ncbi:unnamed protein product [Blepharisma stoltei]|uniref:LNR domain-containing protein n=1 Tax=Blepharisma stoltei TaxID=1481888 RepID=A0AAU9J6H0_9CILI|nr:unnamed protein product [Blepharisma stoltei]
MLIIFTTLLYLSEALEILCNTSKCPKSIRGDGNCNPGCYTLPCKYDTGAEDGDYYSLWNSDCLWDCILKTDCPSFYLKNGACDDVCNNEYCGYDWGDCSYCGPSCAKDQLGGTCDEGCNIPECYYDMGACKECSAGCNSGNLGNGICDDECNTADCNFDMGDCVNKTCATNCKTWMVGNSVCDEACYVEECEYDKTDCTCAPFCYETMLGDGVCNDECNNLNCKYDNGDCGYCSSGCTIKMLANSVCDSNCNTKDCEWDYYTCGCADGCSVSDYGNCKPECLVGTCNYDRMGSDSSKWCNNQNLVLFTIYQQMIKNDPSYVVSADQCYSASNNQCTLEKALDTATCHQECFISECNYGLCGTSSYSTCTSTLPSSASNLCEFCTTSYSGLGTSCSQCSSSCNYLFLYGLSLSISKISTNFPHLSIYYATSHMNGYSPSGDGSYNNPYQTLDYALQTVTTTQNVLFLINDGNYTLSWGGWWPYSTYQKNQWWRVLPLDSSHIFVKIDSMWINSLQIFGKFEWDNIIFDGYSRYPCHNSEYCSYCPYMTYNASDLYYYNDRGERFSEDDKSWWCESMASSYNWLPVFAPIRCGDCSGYYSYCDPCQITFRNAKFLNFRSQYNCILGGPGILRLFNVDFDNIWLKTAENSAVISMPHNSYFNSKLIYVKGSVTRLNNGYEFGDPVDFRGFLYYQNSESVYIKDVEFKYNLVYRSPDSTLTQASLFYVSNVNFFEINSCTFMYNYCEDGLFNLPLDISKYPGSVNETNYLSYLFKDHVYIHDSTFISNYGNSSFINIDFSNYLLNVRIENSNFELNGVESESLIKIKNAQMLDEYKTETTQSVYSGGHTVEIIYGPRYCKLNDLTFEHNYGNGMIDTTSMTNYELKNLIIDSNGSPDGYDNFNTILLDFFIQNRDENNLYISRNVNNPATIDCEFMVLVESSYSIDISPVTLSNNFCRNSSPTFKILESDTHEMVSINCTLQIANTQQPPCFIFSGNFDRSFTNSTFSNNIYSNEGNGTIVIQDYANLSINNCDFINNTADNGAAIYAYGKDMTISSSNFDSNLSPNGYGGAIYNLMAGDNEGLLGFSECTFNNNSALIGGSVYLAQQESSASTRILIDSSNFTINKASNGSALYIDGSVTLGQDSMIASSIFQENDSTMSSTILQFCNKGSITYYLCGFLGNSAELNSVIHMNASESKVSFDSCTFKHNLGSSVILADNQKSITYIETKKCLFQDNSGIIVSLNNDQLVDEGSSFQSNKVSDGPCFHLQNSAVISKSSTYSDNISLKNGGIFTLENNSSFSCSACDFKNNEAQSSGIVLLNTNCSFYCNFCNFANNKARAEGIIYAKEAYQFSFSNSKFLNNSCENDCSIIYGYNLIEALSMNTCEIHENNPKNGNTISLTNSKLSISSSHISKNKGGLKLSFSDLEISGSSFSNQNCTEGCFINLSSDCNAIIKNSNFINANSTSSGGAIFSSSSSITIESSSFKNIYSQSEGSSIYSNFDSILNIKNSEFLSSYSHNMGGVINAYQTPCSIENSIFDKYSQSGIYGFDLEKLEISGSSFSNGNGILGGAVHCNYCNNIKIGSSKFLNNSASLGGALYFGTDMGKKIENTHFIDGTTFIDNKAENGGAVFSGDANLYVSSSVFLKNQAIADEILEEKEVAKGMGGAVKISCPDGSKCDFGFNLCNFTENEASYSGGAISFDDWPPELQNNTYIDNYAQYGANYASYPEKLLMINENGSLDNHRELGDESDGSTNLLGLAPGQKSSQALLVAVVDHMNQIVTTDDSSFCELKTENSSAIIEGITVVKANGGIYNFSDLTISDVPGQKVIIKLYSTAFSSKNYSDQASQNLFINVNLRNCEIGEENSGNSCQICKDGYYNLDANKSECLPCPEEADCLGSFVMVPKSKHWRDNMYSDKFWKCPNPSACLGSPNPSNISYTGWCSQGYKGNKCQSCESGYSHQNNNKCKKCPDSSSSILITIIMILALLTVAFIMYKASIKSSLKPKSIASVYIKIFINYLQMIVITSTFNLNWPSEVLDLFYVQISLDYIYQQIFSFECLFKDDSQDSVYFRSLIMVAFIPAVMIVLAGMVWIIVISVKSSVKHIWDKYISSCIILIFLVYPSVIRKMFSVFRCTEVNAGEYWLEENLDIKCWNYEHKMYALVVALPALVVWGLLLPAACLTDLIKKKNSLDCLNVKIRYGFLMNWYEKKYYYWEFIILYSKLLLICCSVFLTSIAIKLQALIATILLSVYLQIQFSNNPYSQQKLNAMEFRAKLVCVTIIYSGLFYLTDSLNSDQDLFFYALIIIAHIFFLIHCWINILKEVFFATQEKILQWRGKMKVSYDQESYELHKESFSDIKALPEKFIGLYPSIEHQPESENQDIDIRSDYNLNNEEKVENDHIIKSC